MSSATPTSLRAIKHGGQGKTAHLAQGGIVSHPWSHSGDDSDQAASRWHTAGKLSTTTTSLTSPSPIVTKTAGARDVDGYVKLGGIIFGIIVFLILVGIVFPLLFCHVVRKAREDAADTWVVEEKMSGRQGRGPDVSYNTRPIVHAGNQVDAFVPEPSYQVYYSTPRGGCFDELVI